jgi:hypothetical protein
MFEFLKHVLSGQNQFASGGLLLMVIGSVGAFLRGVPEQLWSWLVQQTTMMITVSDDDDSFVWVKEWFLEQKFLKRIRRVDLDTSLRGAEMALIPPRDAISSGAAGFLSGSGFIAVRTRKAEASGGSSLLPFGPLAGTRQSSNALWMRLSRVITASGGWLPISTCMTRVGGTLRPTLRGFSTR